MLDSNQFREELTHRGFKNTEEFQKKVLMLKVKLGMGPELDSSPEKKFHLLDIDDRELTPEQLKQKRIQKMQKSAAVLREQKRLQQEQEREKLESLKRGENKSVYLRELYIKRRDILLRMQDRKKIKDDSGKRGTL